jgi:hypothetical protein
MRHPNPAPPRPLWRMRDSSDRGEEHPRWRSPAAEALVRSVPTVGGDEADGRGGAGAVVVPSAAAIGDGMAVARWSSS